MPGLRIRHTDPLVRGCLLIVHTPRKPYHIHVDGQGTSVVSTVVWQRLQESGVDHGFVLENEVSKPPDLEIGLRVPPIPKPTKELIENVIRDVIPRATQVTIRS